MRKLPILAIIMFFSTMIGFAQVEKSFENYKEFDFIPCERIIYYNDFMQDTLDKFPQRWLSNSPSEVIKLDEYPGMQWYRMNLGSTNATAGRIEFEENTTIEFDMIANAGKEASQDKSEIQVYFHSTLPDEVMGDYVPGNGGFCFKFEGDAVSAFNWKNHDFTDVNYETSSKELSTNMNKKIHVSIAVQKSRVRLYINQFKVVDMENLLPDGIPPMDRISFFSNGKNMNFSLMVSNLIVKTGVTDMRDNLLKQNKFSSTDIKFLALSDTLKSESYAVMKEVAQIINENPSSIKFKIAVYGDNNESGAVNNSLLQKRAEAVRKVLIDIFDVSEKRLSNEFLIQKASSDNNLNSEQKASNRKVEFIKLAN